MKNSSNVAEHYNARPNQGIAVRETSQIFRLRAFNNWVKAIQIGMHAKPQMDVLDLACGKGGDLGKWERARIRRYHGMDIAPISIEHAQERLKEMRHSRLEASFESRDAFSHPFHLNFECDLVSCQFALHYAFINEKTLKQALENVSRCLKPGGLFFGTIADGSQIRKMEHFQNSVFSIKFSNDKWKELGGGFGVEYTFNLVDAIEDCPEFLSNHMILEAMAEAERLELLYYLPFKEFYMHHAPQNLSMLERMQVVENGCLMLSQDELQVAELYSAFCFRKISK